MTTPSEKAIEDVNTLKLVAKVSGRSPEEVIKLLKNPNMSVINDPENPYKKVAE